jgi:hypothetical protein
MSIGELLEEEGSAHANFDFGEMHTDANYSYFH